MHFKYKTLCLAIAAMSFGNAYADEGDKMFSFSGFGTVGVTHSDNSNADYTATPMQPDGAGYSRSFSSAVDTKLGLQVDAKFSDKFSGVLQLVSRQAYDNTYTPQVEWANLSYKLEPELRVRVGRSVWPLLINSETQFIGFGNQTVRNNAEALANMPNTSLVGIDVAYRFNIGEGSNTIQPLYGNNSLNYPTPPGTSLQMKVNGITGISDTYEIGGLKLHAAYMKMTYDIVTAIPNAAMTANPYRTWSVGANYDPGDWYVTAEYLKGEDDSYGNAHALMLGAGYRIGDWTPYVFNSTEHVDSLGLSGDLGTGVKAGDEQAATGLGVRWDFRKNMDFKLQYEHLKTGPIAAFFPISMTNIQPNFYNNPNVNAITAVVDFVF